MKFDFYRLLPAYWAQNRPTCYEWDAILNKALDTGKITDLKRHTVNVAGMTLWVANWPYCYGTLDNFADAPLPTVKTRKRLRAAICRAAFERANP